LGGALEAKHLLQILFLLFGKIPETPNPNQPELATSLRTWPELSLNRRLLGRDGIPPICDKLFQKPEAAIQASDGLSRDPRLARLPPHHSRQAQKLRTGRMTIRKRMGKNMMNM